MWDDRYAEPGWAYGTMPNDFLVAEYGRLPPGGKVLCLAEGEGRNAVFLAEMGFDVHAVDASQVGVEKTRFLACERGVNVNALQGDLRFFDLGEARWDGIVSIFCHLPPDLRRDVHERVVRALKPGGVLLLEAYRPDQLAYGTGGPPVAPMLMTAESLASELAGLQFDRLEELDRDIAEGKYHNGPSAVVQVVAHR